MDMLEDVSIYKLQNETLYLSTEVRNVWITRLIWSTASFRAPIELRMNFTLRVYCQTQFISVFTKVQLFVYLHVVKIVISSQYWIAL